MAVPVNLVELTKLNVSTGVAFNNVMQCYDPTWIKLYYGNARLPAVYGVDYTVSLALDFASFNVTPTASLLNKIATASEVNKVVVVRDVPPVHDFTLNDAYVRQKIVDIMDRCFMALQTALWDSHRAAGIVDAASSTLTVLVNTATAAADAAAAAAADAATVANTVLTLNIAYVTTIAALKGLDTSIGLAMYDGSHWTLKTIATQTAQVQAAITADTNNAFYAVSTVDATKYLERQFAGAFDMDYLSGLGTADDTTVIQSFFNVVSALGGGDIQLPRGTFIVTELVPPSNSIVRGHGKQTVVKQKALAANGKCVFNCTGKTNITIADLDIDGNGNAQVVDEHNHGINCTDAQKINIINCSIHDCQGDAIALYSSTNAMLCADIKVLDCDIYNLGRHGVCVALYGARRVMVSNCTARVGTVVATSTSKGNPIHAEFDSIPSVFSGDIIIDGNTISDRGITFGGGFENVVISNNTVRDANVAGDFGAICLINCKNFVVNGNAIKGDGATNIAGVYVEDAGQSGAAVVKNAVISSNVIENMGGEGINVLGSGAGVPSLGNVSVSGNILRRNGLVNRSSIKFSTAHPNSKIVNNIIEQPYIGIEVNNASSIDVSGNTISDWTNLFAIYFGTANNGGIVHDNVLRCAAPAGKTGVKIENDATNIEVRIYDNMVRDTAAGVTIGAGALRCGAYDNIVGTQSLVGNFILGAAATTVVANTGVTPTSRIILTPTNAAAATLMGSAKALYIAAKTDKTSFTVATANAAAATGTETFDYRIT